MDAVFTNIPFSEPARAERNLGVLQQLLPGTLLAALPSLLAQLPDPDSALNYLERFAREAPPNVLAYLDEHHAAFHYILVLFSYSRFLSETLIHQPSLVTWLHRPAPRGGLDRLKTPDDLNEEFARFEATAFEMSPALVLARFKRREFLRITLRDVLGLATLAETCLELSTLADVLLSRALRISEQKLENAYGSPQFTDESGRRQPARLSILSLGKLGGQELNYSSDIDLIFLYSHDGETRGGSAGSTSNAEFFVRLAQSILSLITEITPEGPVFRVDMRLRPEGSGGDLAISLPAALNYYRARARQWELQMLIKARCSAGDADCARQFLRELQPLIYPPQPDPAALEAVLTARQEMSRELRRRRSRISLDSGHAAARNVKLSPGGIRDIEFLVQCLARLYAGREPWLRSPSTLVGLQRLHDKDYLTSRDFFRLGSAYEFLRNVEHRMQLRDGLQRHTIPESRDALDRLARRCGLGPGQTRTAHEELQLRVEDYFGAVREIYERILVAHRFDMTLPGPAASAPPGPESSAIETQAAAEQASVPFFPAFKRIRQQHPALGEVVAALLSTSDAHARRGLNRFLSSAVMRSEIVHQLESAPGLLAHAAELFSLSDLAADVLTRAPGEICVLADPEAHWQDTVLATAKDPAALRVAYRRRWWAVVVRALASGRHPASATAVPPPFETFERFTCLAEEALAAALRLASRDLGTTLEMSRAPFCVLAFGRLGTREMDIASDADLVFVVDESVSPADREPWRRATERLLEIVGSHTRDGLLFPVDTRLRPRGGEGELLQSTAYLRSYFREEAQGWEAAAILKARPVVGNLSLGLRVLREIHALLAERYAGNAGAARLAQELVHTRYRMEHEGNSRGPRAGLRSDVFASGLEPIDFKSVRGGYYDIDYILALLLLTTAGPDSERAPLPLLASLSLFDPERLRAVLDVSEWETLRSAAALYRCTDHAARLITGRPVAAYRRRGKETPPGEWFLDLPRRHDVCRLLHNWGIPLPAEFEATIDTARENVRALYQRVVVSRAAETSQS
jgi:glutamate-ammonia-ligase adenylyltransferase